MSRARLPKKCQDFYPVGSTVWHGGKAPRPLASKSACRLGPVWSALCGSGVHPEAALWQPPAPGTRADGT
eukprot:798715-Prymnesium_polylepis.1